MTSKTLDGIQAEYLKKGYLSQQSLNLTNTFIETLQAKDFDTAISAFENEVLNLKLTDDEFIRYNNSANVLKIINKADASLFDAQNQNLKRGIIACAIALVYLAISITELIFCATIILCLPAIANLAWAAYTVDGECE